MRSGGGLEPSTLVYTHPPRGARPAAPAHHGRHDPSRAQRPSTARTPPGACCYLGTGTGRGRRTRCRESGGQSKPQRIARSCGGSRGPMFNYQLDRHCSKTGWAEDGAGKLFNYQLDRHCSKTHIALNGAADWFNYQLDRHCSKTDETRREVASEFNYQLDRHCSKT